MSTTETPAATQMPAASVSRPWPMLALAASVGLAGGALTLLGQKLLASSGGWFMLVNSAAPWLMVAFAVGTRVPGRWRTAAAAGALTQPGLVIGYYASAQLSGLSAASSSVLVWIGTGVVAGPAYGVAGAMWRDRHLLPRLTALGLLGGVWIYEGVHALWLATDAGSHSGPGTTAGWCAIAVGVLLPLILGRSVRDRLVGLLATAPVAASVFAAYQAVGWVFMHR